MVVESAFKDQNTRKLVSFHMLVSNLLCRVCERSYRAKSGVITQEFLWEQTPDIIVSCELWMQRTPDILVFRKFGAILYVLCSQATLDTIVSTCKFSVVTTRAWESEENWRLRVLLIWNWNYLFKYKYVFKLYTNCYK